MDDIDDVDRAAMSVTVDHGLKRIIFHFHRIVDYDLEGANVYSALMGRTFAECGPDHDLIIDYTSFEPEHLTAERLDLFLASAAALKTLGFESYIRVVPERLRAFFAPYARLIADAMVNVLTVETLAEAHAKLDAAPLRRPARSI